MQDWPEFKAAIFKRTGIDLNAYKERQMHRRITTLMTSRGADGFAQYLNILDRDKDSMTEFLNRITINVSEFFRNPERFQDLRLKHVPRLLEGGRRQLKTWSAGCATGEEPYSLAMLLAESVPGQTTPVLATDLDRNALQEARAGRYPAVRLGNVSPDLKARYFTVDGGDFVATAGLKKLIRFQRHDLLRDPYDTEFDLILCRNVVIYFTEEAKADLYGRFSGALRPGGLLFTGATEQIFQPQRFNLKPIAPFFYERI